MVESWSWGRSCRPTHVPLQQERLARDRMIEEQDRAFKESLEADRRKVC